MKEIIRWQVGDLAELKKPHACGSSVWAIARVGMDMRLICRGCGRELLMPRHELERRVKRRIEPEK